MNKFIVIVPALAMPALFSAAQPVGAEDMKGTNMTMKPTTSPADKAFADSMKTMMSNMHVKPTGKSDADFVLMMIPQNNLHIMSGQTYHLFIVGKGWLEPGRRSPAPPPALT